MSEASVPGWRTEDHALYAVSVRKFLADEVVPNGERWRKNGVVDREVWTKAGETSWGAAIQTIVAHYIVAYGSEEQKLRWLPRWLRAS